MCKVIGVSRGYALAVITDFGSGRHLMVDALENGKCIARVGPQQQGYDKVETDLTRRQGLNDSWALDKNLECSPNSACSRQ